MTIFTDDNCQTSSTSTESEHERYRKDVCYFDRELNHYFVITTQVLTLEPEFPTDKTQTRVIDM